MSKLGQLYYKIPRFIRNKYLLFTIAFAVWMLFFDHNNYVNQFQTNKELNKLKEQRNYFKTEINKINEEKTALFNNPDLLEKFAREKYFMKKDNEDVYVIDVDSTK